MREAWKDPQKRKRRSEAAKARWANEEFHKKAVQSVTLVCKRAVKCVETGEVFDVIRDAGNRYGVWHANISRACKTGYKCGGYHWEYVDDVS